MTNNSLSKQGTISNEGKSTLTVAQFLKSDTVQKNFAQKFNNKDDMVRFTSSITSAVNSNPALETCDKGSIVSSALTAHSLGLHLNPQLGLAYLVPFKDKKKGQVATFILGYRGYIQLAIRSGQYKRINVGCIKEGELKSFNPFTEEAEFSFILDEKEREQRPTVGYVASLELMNGFQKIIYWSKEKMLNHADRFSSAFSLKGTKGEYAKVSYEDYLAGKFPDSDGWKYSSFWYQNFDGMACKTMLRQLISKWGIMSIDMQKAYERDGAVELDNATIYNDDSDMGVPQDSAPDNATDSATGDDEEKKLKVIEDGFFNN